MKYKSSLKRFLILIMYDRFSSDTKTFIFLYIRNVYFQQISVFFTNVKDASCPCVRHVYHRPALLLIEFLHGSASNYLFIIKFLIEGQRPPLEFFPTLIFAASFSFFFHHSCIYILYVLRRNFERSATARIWNVSACPIFFLFDIVADTCLISNYSIYIYFT